MIFSMRRNAKERILPVRAPAEPDSNQLPKSLSGDHKIALVLRLIRGEAIEALAREGQILETELQYWSQLFLEAGKQPFRPSFNSQDREQQTQTAVMEHHASAESSSSAVSSDDEPQGKTILIVDDDDQVREYIRACLAPLGYDILEARFNSEALLLSQRHEGPIHLIIADVLMPGMCGPEFAAKVMAVRPEMKVLYVSGGSSEAVEGKLLKMTTSAFLQKPFEGDTLLMTVRKVLQSDF
jgi:PleD family two-component response regulator